MLFSVRQGSINARLVLFEKVLEHSIVQEGSSLGLWKHQPKKKRQLECIVEWNEINQKVNKDFNNLEERKNDPVHQPLRVVALVLRFQRLK